MADQYNKPYLESSVFIAWVKGEVIDREVVAEQVDVVDGRRVVRRVATTERVERGRIGQHILSRAEEGDFAIYTSTLTWAEVHRSKGHTKLSSENDDEVLEYFEHDHIKPIDVDRRIGEEANRLCRRYGLNPADAVHLACALRAGCDVLLTWDSDLLKVAHDDIRTEEPRMLGQLQLIGDDEAAPSAASGETGDEMALPPHPPAAPAPAKDAHSIAEAPSDTGA